MIQVSLSDCPRKTKILDELIGNKIRARRMSLNLTQDDLAVALNITYQQVQKYEKGKNRVSAARLYEVSKILKVDFAYFFKNIEAGSE